MRYRPLVAAAAATLAMTSLTSTSAAANSTETSAVNCSGWPVASMVSSDQTVEGQYSYMRKGPYGACDVVLRLGAGWTLDVACSVRNDYGHTWSYAHFNDGSRRYWGWIYDASLQGGGAGSYC